MEFCRLGIGPACDWMSPARVPTRCDPLGSSLRPAITYFTMAGNADIEAIGQRPPLSGKVRNP
jgi:hypothetical protein